jgi:hypothetical protein
MVADKKHFLVSGVARSGTTALAELLNSHEAVCVGIERFKFQFLLQHNHSASLFERERFFDFRPEDTNLSPTAKPHWQTVYDAIAQKWDAAVMIGDKVPDMTAELPAFIAANPDFKYIYILRNLKDVGLSWQARANRTRDSWPAKKGFAAACESWSAQMQGLHAMMQTKEMNRKVLLLDYDTMYAEGSRCDEVILKYMGLDPSAAFSETFRKHAEFARNKAARKIPAQYVDVYKAVDKSFARDMRKRARAQAKSLLPDLDTSASTSTALPDAISGPATEV